MFPSITRQLDTTLLVGVDNLDEVLLKTGAADQGAVYIGAGGQGLAVVRSDRASVQDAGGAGDLEVLNMHNKLTIDQVKNFQFSSGVDYYYLGADILLKPAPDGEVNLLGLLGGRGLARPNGPHGLIGQYHARPV